MKINYVRNNGCGFVTDLTTSMSMTYNSEFENFMSKYGFEPNKEIQKIIKSLKRKVDFTGYEKVLDVLLNLDIDIIFSCLKPINCFKITDIDSLIATLESLTEKDIKLNTILSINEFSYKTHLTEEDACTILQNPANLIEFIDKCELEESFKWKLFNFLNNTSVYMEKFISFLPIYYKQYEKVVSGNQKAFDKLSNHIEKNINEKGFDYIKELAGSFMEPDAFSNCDELYVSPLFFNYASICGCDRQNTGYAIIGIEVDKLIKKLAGEDDLDSKLNLFKNICDKTRFNILRLLVNERLYNQEIAEKVGITMATTTYHMDFLLGSNLVHLERVGHKTYYALNKDALIEGINFLKETFELDK